MTKYASLLVLAALALAACQNTGQGPVELSRVTAAGFERYKELDFPGKVFAITDDGGFYSYSWCEHTVCAGNLSGNTVHRCEVRNRKRNETEVPCHVLAVGNTIVWEGEVTFPDTVAAYRLNPASTKHRGPTEAHGAIIYAPGNGSRDLPQSDNRVPVYVRTMQSDGWDAFKAVTNNNQLRGALTHERAADGLRRHIADLRVAGYRRIAIASQSFGAWVSLVGGADPETWADANIAAVPVCCGPRIIDGEVNDRFQRNQPELRRVIRELKVPTMIMYFAGDVEFEDPARAGIASKALARNGVRHQVIDKPIGLSGHSAAWSNHFNKVFGPCVAAFASGDPYEAACDAPELDQANLGLANVALSHRQDLEKYGLTRATAEDLRATVGHSLVGYRLGVPVTYFLPTDDQAVALFEPEGEPSRQLVLPIRLADGEMCLDECFTVYHQDRNFVAAVNRDGRIMFHGVVVPGNPRSIEVADAPAG